MEGEKTDKRVYPDKMETSKAKRAKTKEGFPTHDDIDELSLSLPNDWKRLGAKLKVPYDHIQRINRNQVSVEEKATDMLIQWVQTFNGSYSDANKTLIGALENIERMDLAAKVKDMYKRFQETAEPVGMSSDHAASGSSSSTKIKKQKTDKPEGFPTHDDINELSLSLPNDWKRLGTKLKVSYDHIQRINRNQGSVEEKATEMLMQWIQTFNGSYSDANKTLIGALENIKRMDLAGKVKAMYECFVRSQPSIKTGTRKTAEPVDHAASGSSSSMEIEIQESDKPDSSGDTSGQDPSPPFSEYPMNRNPRGLCVIINNEKFKGAIPDRAGSSIDADNLKELFQNLHFDAKVKNDRKADEMTEVLNDFSKMDHSQYDCFACCILSHGGNGQISGTDGESVKIQNILQHFKDVKNLNGKPKLFFFQACQGSKPQHGVQTDEDINEDVGIGAQVTVPKEADFLISYSTVSGYVSYRDPAKGTWYVNDLVEVFAKNHTKKDLLTMLTEVNKLLSTHTTSKDGKDCYQVGAICSTLRKSVNLRDFST